jgi:acyl-CoA thioesterase-1
MWPASRVTLLAVALGVVSAIACGLKGGSADRSAPAGSAGADVSASTPARSGPRVVILGDSLTAGLGLPLTDAYPTLLQRRTTDEGLAYTVVNAGVSGDTSAGGVSRLDWALDGDVRVLILALGGNDGLRGLPPSELATNLSAIIDRAQHRGITVVLAGMEAPPNFGPQYTGEFHDVYPRLAKKYHLPLIPFLLDGVAGNVSLNQPDGVHPTKEGARIVADNVWTVLKPVLVAESRRADRGRIPGS